AGHDVTLCPPLGRRSVGTDVVAYGRRLAAELQAAGPVDVLVGMSVGTQGAVAAALAGAPAGQLVLVGPTIDPQRRGVGSAFTAWMSGEDHRNAPGPAVHLPDWVRAGPHRIYRSLRSAIAFRLEDELPGIRVPITIVHGDADQLSPLPYALALADRSGARLLIMPDAPHSWPVADGARFIDLIDELT
ncbi:MAG: alpha/beta hydrolase, partial [Microlunatus sp.]|nr:alpha/beta hydrolase [Microlunatus sp.]